MGQSVWRWHRQAGRVRDARHQAPARHRRLPADAAGSRRQPAGLPDRGRPRREVRHLMARPPSRCAPPIRARPGRRRALSSRERRRA